MERKEEERHRRKWIHPAPLTNSDEAVSSACADLKSNSARGTKQGSYCPEETPSTLCTSEHLCYSQADAEDTEMHLLRGMDSFRRVKIDTYKEGKTKTFGRYVVRFPNWREE